jgi:general secretion pathway protein C
MAKKRLHAGWARGVAEAGVDDNGGMSSRWFAFVLWALVAASAVAWAQRLVSRPEPVPTFAVPVAESAAARGDALRLLGREPAKTASVSEPSAAAVQSRFKLVGVVAPRDGQVFSGALALISTDDKPARPVRLGAPVGDGLVLLSVHRRGATLGPEGAEATVRLELPERPGAATGVPGGAVLGGPGGGAGVAAGAAQVPLAVPQGQAQPAPGFGAPPSEAGAGAGAGGLQPQSLPPGSFGAPTGQAPAAPAFPGAGAAGAGAADAQAGAPTR